MHLFLEELGEILRWARRVLFVEIVGLVAYNTGIMHPDALAAGGIGNDRHTTVLAIDGLSLHEQSIGREYGPTGLFMSFSTPLFSGSGVCA